jgi:hypothetical protein
MREDRRELRAVAALPGGSHQREHLLPLLVGQVQLAGQPTTRAAQTVAGRLAGVRFDLYPHIASPTPTPRAAIAAGRRRRHKPREH